MISCAECIQNLYPDDPRVPSGRYHQSTCDYYCDKPKYYRELETQQPPEQVIVHYYSDMSKQNYELLQQTALELEYLKKKLAEHTGYKRKVPVKSGKTKGIKIE